MRTYLPVAGAVLALALLGPPCAAPCRAESGPGEPGEPGGSDPIEIVREYDSKLETRKVGLLGLRVTHPKRLSGSIGAMLVKQHPDFDCTTLCSFRGPFVQLEPGLNGGQLSVGYAELVAEKGRNAYYLRRVIVGFGLRAAVLRTWGDASVDPVRQTFLGAEGDFTIAQVNFRLGLFHSITSANETDRWLISGGIGWGF
jgi:hypothetical protein